MTTAVRDDWGKGPRAVGQGRLDGVLKSQGRYSLVVVYALEDTKIHIAVPLSPFQVEYLARRLAEDLPS